GCTHRHRDGRPGSDAVPAVLTDASRVHGRGPQSGHPVDDRGDVGPGGGDQHLLCGHRRGLARGVRGDRASRGQERRAHPGLANDSQRPGVGPGVLTSPGARRMISGAMTPETYLQRVRALLPALRERAVHAEQLRRLPDETFADFQDAGLFRCLQPKRYGGFELDPGTLYQAVMEIGTVCGSSAWILGVIGVHNWHLALFAPEAQDDVWGKDTSIQLSTSLAPTGAVERVEGGFRLRGRWPFSSGCDFCHWAVLGGAVPPLDKGAPPDVRTFLVPRSDYVIDDTWHAVGLCGTGSKDLLVDGAFVPEYRTHSYRDAFYLTNPGAVVNDAPLYRLPFGLVFPACIGSPAIGVALGVVAAIRAHAGNNLEKAAAVFGRSEFGLPPVDLRF